MPWVAKALWAPLVDRYFWLAVGRRKSWIIPSQALLAAACAAAAFVDPAARLPLLLLLVFAMNLFAATQDIAVDGLAVDILDPDELGSGNTAQVVGYKVGMLTGGGLLVYLSERAGWRGLFGGMSATIVAVLIVAALHREQPAAQAGGGASVSLRDVLRAVIQALRQPGGGWLLAFIASYKVGETALDVMFKPFLVDQGYTPQVIGLWIGTYGMVASLAGSAAGGWLATVGSGVLDGAAAGHAAPEAQVSRNLADEVAHGGPPGATSARTRRALLRAVAITATLRIAPMVFEVSLAFGHPTPAAVIAAVCFELFFGGALTTAMFAFMMAAVDRRVGATHYTLLASVEVLGKSVAGALSGVGADYLGYAGLFGVATALSVGFLGLLRPLAAKLGDARDAIG